MTLLNKAPMEMLLRRVLNSRLDDTDFYTKEGELIYTTDSKQLFVSDDSDEPKNISVKRTSTAADPTTTELPNDGDASIHKNTTSSSVYLAYNDSGTIKKVALS